MYEQKLPSAFISNNIEASTKDFEVGYNQL